MAIGDAGTVAESGATDAPILSYSYKPSVMGAPFVFSLENDALAWSRGRHSGLVRYRDIARLRMSFRPVTMQNARYQLEVWAPDAPRLPIASASWRSMVEMQAQGPAFRIFVMELHRRIAASGARPRCVAGIFAPLYWLGAFVFAATSLGIAVLTVRALAAGQWAGAAFIVAFLAVFLWQAGQFFGRNRPMDYSLAAPPAHLLPRA